MAVSAPMRWVSLAAVVCLSAGLSSVARAEDKPAAAPVDFIAEARELLVVGACAPGTSTKATVKADVAEAHCKRVKAAQDEYKKTWITVAAPFFKQHVPANLPKTVVYPFAGGDLSTALTVYPDADEITTLSLEPAGDVRALGKLDATQTKQSLAVVATELESLYRSNFSKTMNMISAMRGGKLPTQLIFSLSALHIHGYEPVALRYFKLDNAGELVYLTAADVARLDKIGDVSARNRGFGNVEIKFKKQGGTREQTYRHIVANLDNEHLVQWAAPVKHLKKKGRVAAMTKAASYLLSFGDFSTIRNYLLENVEWMVSDTTGVPPPYGAPLGFQYETYGGWEGSNMAAGNGSVRPHWKALWAAQPRRELAFRFGYPNNKGEGHLVFMKRGEPPAKPVKPAITKTAKPAPAKP